MKDNCPLRFDQVSKTYRSGAERLRILDQGDLAIEAGEIVALVAPSGAGKSTLLHLAALLDSPTGGKVFLQGRDTSKLDNAGKTEMRRREVGYVYQSHHLLDEFTALENVLLPQLVNGADEKQARRRGLELLGRFGLQDRASFLPGSLSGGEKQRVAIARALANRPALLLADEPTGNLDEASAERVFEQFMENVQNDGVSAFIVTHNLQLAARMNRVLTLKAGKILPF